MRRDQHEALLRTHHPDAIRKRLDLPARLQYVSDAVLGAMDGCVTTFAVVSGAVGAGFASPVALVLGFANLLADGFSMAVSNYESIRAQDEFADSIRRSEETHIDAVPAGEREEIRQIFQRKGFEGAVLEQIVATITQDRELWVQTMLAEEHGITSTSPNAWRSAATTFTAFVLVGAMPLAPFLVPGMETGDRFMLSAIIAAVMFFLVGVLKSVVFTRPALRAGFRTLATGAAAASIAFVTGHLLREVFGIGGS